jgi:hypothetical protein
LADLGASGASIHDNTFLDPAPSTTRGRAGVSAALAGVYIVDNSFAGFNVAIQAGGGGSIVQGNQITGTHNLPFVGRSILAGGAGTVTVRENSLSAASGSSVIGIDAATGAMLIRNEVTGHEHGVTVNFNISGITLDGDRIWGNSGDGLRISDNLPEDPRTSVTATNVTIVDNTLDIRLSGVDSVDLTLDSSIIETILFSESTCAITFSRADAIGADPSGCDGFQTTADPMLADPAIGDLHLEPDSPMLDLGNPADPGVGAVDFDGDPRAVAATCGDVSRRDIGSDEFVPDCDPPETTIDSGPGDGEAINEATPAIAFSSDDPAATFECRVEPAGFGLCSHTYQHILGPLGEGSYTFAVRAVDVAENEDPTPAQRTFTVDLTDPKTRFTRTPPRKTERKRVKFGFDADEEATFECRLDSRPRFECESPERMKVMPGRHQFRVVGTDEAGNPDPTPAMFRFRRLRPR